MRALRPSRGGWLVLTLLAVATASSCERRRATNDECERIFDRLVTVELAERGFRDPVLTQRRALALRQKLAGERVVCVGRPLAVNAMTCIEAAPNAEAIVHGCLGR